VAADSPTPVLPPADLVAADDSPAALHATDASAATASAATASAADVAAAGISAVAAARANAGRVAVAAVPAEDGAVDRPRVDLAVFDIAGTTVEEHGAVYQALRAAVEAAGGAPSATDIERWMGADKRAAIRALLAAVPAAAAGSTAVTPDGATSDGSAGDGGAAGDGATGDGAGASGGTPDAAAVERVFLDFRARLDTAYRTRPPMPIPGVVEAFGTLRARGIRIALTTGFDRSVVGPLLASLGWDGGLLDAVVCADDVPTGRPAPYMIFRAMEQTGVTAVARVLVAGDTVRDLQAGTNAGAGLVVGVLTGQVGATTLGAARHTHLLASVADIPAMVTGPLG